MRQLRLDGSSEPYGPSRTNHMKEIRALLAKTTLKLQTDDAPEREYALVDRGSGEEVFRTADRKQISPFLQGWIARGAGESS